jgi:ABC-type dipeptide/oligopeptide/nickel transport system permease component
MLSYLVRRISGMLPMLLFIIALNFALAQAAPGDPISRMYMEDQVVASEEQLERARERYGLNRPLHVQFLDYVTSMAQGDFGKSIKYGAPVLEMIMDVLPTSMQLGAAASVLALLFGIPLGVLSALRKNTRLDYVIVGGSLALNTVPVYVLAPLLMILMVIQFKLVPNVPFGWKGLFSYNSILPVALLSTGPLAVTIRQMRTGVLEVLSEDYVRTARAKGLPQFLLVVRHVMPPALLPVVTSMGYMVASLLRGSIFVDILFGIPGFGRLSVEAVIYQDYPLLLGCAFFSALVVMVANLMVDMIYPILDARVVYE